jgi:hypothetical protein
MRRSLTGQAGPVRRDNMHPMFVALFIKADADDLLTQERDRRRRVRQARRRPARVIRATASPDYPRRL